MARPSFLQWLVGGDRKRPADYELELDDVKTKDGQTVGQTDDAIASSSSSSVKRQKIECDDDDDQGGGGGGEIELQRSDVLVVQSHLSHDVTLYSDMMASSQHTSIMMGVDGIVGAVQAQGGRFIVLDALDGSMCDVVQKKQDIVNLVTKALQGRREGGPNISEHPSISAMMNYQTDAILDLSPEALAATTVAFEPDIMAEMGGLACEPPHLSAAQIKIFLKEATSLEKKTATNLHQLLPQLNNPQDAVHLYRNFFNEDEVIGQVKGRGRIILFSRREVDLVMYAIVKGVSSRYVRTLMPYRKLRSIRHKLTNPVLKEFGVKLSLKADRMKELENCVGRYFVNYESGFED